MINHNDDIVGQQLNSNYGDFIVIGATDIFRNKTRMFLCKFFKPEYYGIFSKDAIKRGSIKNKYYPYIDNVACVGNAHKNHYLYPRWKGMISRCYNKNDKDYKNYGNKGIVVCKRWLFFDNYIEDVKLIEGWDEELVKNSKLELDKDISKNNIYDLISCLWITKKENLKESNARKYKTLKHFEANSLLTGETIISCGVNQFCKNNNFIYSCVIRCLNGERKTHNNWTFRYIE